VCFLGNEFLMRRNAGLKLGFREEREQLVSGWGFVCQWP